MKKASLRASLILAIFCMFQACQKETSVENGGFSGAALGVLTDSSGSCKSILVNGSYVVDTTVTDSNYIKVNVNFTTQGKYLISSDTVNGLWFLDSGFALSTGATVVKIKAKGKPLLAKTSDFALGFNGNYCSFSVAVTTSGSSSSGGSGSGVGTDYFPVTAGSSWSYQYLPTFGGVDKITVTAQSDTYTLDSLTYTKFKAQYAGITDPAIYLYAKNTTIGNYYTYSTVDFDHTSLFDSTPSSYISYAFLKEKAAVGESWESGEYGEVKYVSSTGTEYGKSKVVFTIISKNTDPYTIGGKKYDNVINVKREIKFMNKTGTTYRTLLTGNCYYAKGYGMIDQVIVVGTSTQSVSLTTTPTIK